MRKVSLHLPAGGIAVAIFYIFFLKYLSCCGNNEKFIYKKQESVLESVRFGKSAHVNSVGRTTPTQSPPLYICLVAVKPSNLPSDYKQINCIPLTLIAERKTISSFPALLRSLTNPQINYKQTNRFNLQIN